MTDEPDGKAAEQLAAIESLDRGTPSCRARLLVVRWLGGRLLGRTRNEGSRRHRRGRVEAGLRRRFARRWSLPDGGTRRWKPTSSAPDTAGRAVSWSSRLSRIATGRSSYRSPSRKLSGQPSLSETTSARYWACVPVLSHLSCFATESNESAKHPRRRQRTLLITPRSWTSSLGWATIVHASKAERESRFLPCAGVPDDA